MKINDFLTPAVSDFRVETVKKCLSKYKELQRDFVQIHSGGRLQIFGFKFGDNVSGVHLREINFAT